MPTTLADVARHAGVSPATASRVLNGSDRKPAADIAARVIASADALGYIANAQAQALARSTTMLIGLIVHDIDDPYFSSLAAGAQAAAEATRRQTLLAVTHREKSRTIQFIKTFTAQRVDAIILTGSQDLADPDTGIATALSVYQRSGGKVAIVGSEIPGFTAEAQVIPQNYEGGRLLAEHLLAQGETLFTIIAGPKTWDASHQRLTGFTDALVAAAAPTPEIIHTEFNRDGGLSAATTWLNAHARDDILGRTIFATADVLAVGVLTALHNANIAVPHDVRLAGFDDIPLVQDAFPPLTSVRLNLADLGRAAVNGLFDGSPTPWSMRFPAEVIARRSTAAGTSPATDTTC